MKVPTGLLHEGICVVLLLAGVVAVVFALTRGRRLGAGRAFGLGGLCMAVYAVVFFATERFGRVADVILAGEAASGTAQFESERGAMVLKWMFAVDLNALVEPIALVLLALGFGALARAEDARRAARPVPADDTAPAESPVA